MSIPRVLNSPWAILPEKLIQISDAYVRYLRGEKSDFDISKYENPDDQADGSSIAHDADQKNADRAGSDSGYHNFEGVAIIQVIDVLAKRMNMIMEMSGGTSTQILMDNFNMAMADPEVRDIVLLIDSPGGTVDGTQSLANAIYDARGKGKRIIAICDGMACSAAYWIASAAEKIYMTEETAPIGSIGVVATHVDYSKYYEMKGMKFTEVTAGKYKRIDSQYEPLSEEGQKVIKSEVDQIYEVFVNDIARNRGVSVDTVLTKMADAKVFIGRQAIDAGLVDEVMSLDSLIGGLVASYQKAAVITPTKGSIMADDKIKPDAKTTASPVVEKQENCINADVEANKAVEVVAPTENKIEGVGKIQTETEPAAKAEAPVKIDPIASDRHAVGAETKASAVGSKPGDEKPSNSGGNIPMSEFSVEKVKKILALPTSASDQDVYDACEAAARTRHIAVTDGRQFVALLDYEVLKGENRKLNQQIASLHEDLDQERRDRAQEKHEHDAEDAFQDACRQKKVMPSQRNWAKQYATDDLSGFKAWASTMSPVVSMEDGDGKMTKETVLVDAAAQFNIAVEARRQKYIKEGKKVPNIGDLQVEISKDNPELYKAYRDQVS